MTKREGKKGKREMGRRKGEEEGEKKFLGAGHPKAQGTSEQILFPTSSIDLGFRWRLGELRWGSFRGHRCSLSRRAWPRRIEEPFMVLGIEEQIEEVWR